MDARIKRMVVLAAVVVVTTQVAMRCADLDATAQDRIATAQALAAEHRYDDALEAYRRTTAEFPHDPRSWVAYGDARLELRADLAGAREAYRSGIAASSDLHLTAAAQRRSGLLAWATGGVTEAETALRRAAEGGDAAGERALALLLSCQRRPDAAAVIATALQHQPGDARLLLCAAADAAVAGDRERGGHLADQGLAAAGAAASPETAADPWVRYLAARYAAATGDQTAAARSLDAARNAATAVHIEDAPPLSRADLLADPAFAHPEPALAAAIARWPERPALAALAR